MLVTKMLTLAAMATSAFAFRPFAGKYNNNKSSNTDTYNASHVHDQGPADHPVHSKPSSTTTSGPGIDDGEPSLSHHHALSRRGVGAYWCTGNDWSGKCTWSAADNSCHGWSTGPTGSFGPDVQASCTLYSQSGCEGGSKNIRWPGTRDVGYDITVGSNGEIDFPESWRCHT